MDIRLLIAGHDVAGFFAWYDDAEKGGTWTRCDLRYLHKEVVRCYHMIRPSSCS